MADDTRQREDLSKEALTVHPENKAFTGTHWQDAKTGQPYTPPQSANAMEGASQNTAGGKVPDVTLGNAFQGGLKWEDFKELPKRPCVRDALMTGIGAGFAIGGSRLIFGATVWKACNWAIGSWALGSGTMYQYCLFRRHAEKEGMMRAVEILNKKEVEKRAREQQRERAKEERRKLKEQEQEEQFASLRGGSNAKMDGRPWWKVW